MKCCILGDYPKKFLHYIKKDDGTVVQVMLSEPDHLKVVQLMRDNPEAKLTIKEKI